MVRRLEGGMEPPPAIPLVSTVPSGKKPGLSLLIM